MKKLTHRKFKVGKEEDGTAYTLETGHHGIVGLVKWKRGSVPIDLGNLHHRELKKLILWLQRIVDHVDR